VKLPAAGEDPPIAGGDERSSVPPSVSDPESVTVPVRVSPLTVPVPDTDVTVPEPVPAPMAVLKSDALSVETVLSAFTLGNVIALGLARVKKLLPTVVAPRLVLPVAATRLVEPPFHVALSV
jgi:hypothetical protein